MAGEAGSNAEPLLEKGKRRGLLEILMEDMQIRYDGVLQAEGEVYEIASRARYVWLEYVNVFMATLIYPTIPFILSHYMLVEDAADDDCFQGNFVPYYFVLCFESIFLVTRASVFVQAFRKRNGTYATMQYNQIGGLWVEVEEPIGFVAGQFAKDVAAGLCIVLSHVDIYSNIVSMMVIQKMLKVSAAHKSFQLHFQILILVMVASTLVHVLPRLHCLFWIPRVMTTEDPSELGLHKAFAADTSTMIDDPLVIQRPELPVEEILRNFAVSKLFLYAENPFIGMLFPPDAATLSVEDTKRTLFNKMRFCIFKVLVFSLPQAACQFDFTLKMKALGCVNTSNLIIYVSISMSVGLGILSIIQAYMDFTNYRTIEAKMFINKHIKGSSNRERPIIVVKDLSHTEVKLMAEYYLKHPNDFDELNIEKGELYGYSKDIKIKVPSTLDREKTYKVRMNFTPGYVTFSSPEDQQIVVDFAKAFPKLTLNIGFGVCFPADLKAELEAMGHVEITTGF